MNTKTRVILIGWNPMVVDYSKWPGLTPEKLTAALEADRSNLNDLGYDANLLFIDDAETAFDVVKEKLNQENYDCVLIGAGVRTVDEHFIVFERLVNAVHETAPNAKICFNTNPSDTAEAVQRWA
ncbi:MAG: hypothetical protein MJA28_10575 [Gammaproteobacteria bacterium]|nr:hypothetical protein [Gammaproteobacteria bacterium]